MKKTVIILIASAVLLTLCGCASLIEGEYTSSKPHESTAVQPPQVAEMTIEVTEDSEIADALIRFIEEGVTYGKLKFAYDGDIESALAAACIDVPGETPLGSYAAAYIGYSLNKIVSYYEADVSITYKHTLEEVNSIKSFGSTDSVTEALLDAMGEHLPDLTFTCRDSSADSEFVAKSIESLYYEHPEIITYLPDAEIITYPEGGFPCIIEVLFSYNYTKASTQSRSVSMEAKLNEIIEGAGDRRGDEAVSYFSDFLRSNVEFDYERESADDYSRWYNVYTAYGALVMERAAGEGYAMAMKMLCDRYEIECWVVRGRLNNVSHSWNIIKLESGDCYHVDCSMTEDDATFYTDEEMSESYWWDSDTVPECSGASLLPPPEVTEPEVVEPEEPTEPAVTDIPPLPDEGIIPELPPIDIDIEPEIPPEEPVEPVEPTDPVEGDGEGEAIADGE